METARLQETRGSRIRVCLFDGYIRNRTRLREELCVQPSRSQDAEHEILEAAFAKWGYNIGNHLFGSFALAIHNEERGEVFCARDLLGLKPLYYRLDPNGTFCYGSDIDAVVGKEQGHKDMDIEALQYYLMLGYPAGEKTLYAGGQKADARTLPGLRRKRVPRPSLLFPHV